MLNFSEKQLRWGLRYSIIKNNKQFMKLVEDLIINYPEIEKSDYQLLMKNKQKEILMLNNICLSTMQSSYIGISDKI